MPTATARQRESLDALVWRVNGGGPSAVEAVLAANRGLAAISAALPEGTVVTIPDSAPAQAELVLVNLWD
jgi:phage tail protein X